MRAVPRLIALTICLFLSSWSLYALEPPVEPVLRLEAGSHTSRLSRLARDGEGRILATASQDKTARVWNAKTGRLISILRPPIADDVEGELNTVALSPDGTTAACAGSTGAIWQERCVYLFDAGTGRLKQRLLGITNTVAHMAYSRDGRYLAVLQHPPGELLLFRTSDYKAVGHYTDLRGGCYGLDFGPPDANGVSRLVITSWSHESSSPRLGRLSWNGKVRLFEVGFDNLKLIDARDAPGGDRPHVVRFSPDGSLIALCYADRTRVDVLSSRDLSLLYSPDVTGITDAHLLVLAWAGDGEKLYGGGDHRDPQGRTTLRTWSDKGRGVYVDTSATVSRISDMVCLPDGGLVYAASSGTLIGIEPDGRRRTLVTLVRPNFTDNPLYLSPDGTTVRFGFEREGRSQVVFSMASRGLRAYEPGLAQPKLSGPVKESTSIKVTNWKETKEPKLNGSRIRLYPFETSWAYAITPDGTEVIHGSTRYLRLLTKGTEEKWRAVVTDTVLSVTVSGDGKVAVAALANSTLNWFRMSDGRLLISLFLHGDRKRWVLWSPSGFYDCSEGADELLGWHVNNGKSREALFYPLARFFERYFRPDVVTGIMANLETDAAVLASLKGPAAERPVPGRPTPADLPAETSLVELAKKLPPQITILSPRSGETVDKEQLQVTVAAKDMGGGVEDVRLFHNGKRVPEDEKTTRITRKGKNIDKTYTLTLLEGENAMTALALSEDMIEGNPAEITVTRTGQSKTPDLYLVLIGIDTYKNPALNLSFAALDTASIREFFTSLPSTRLFGGVYTHAVLNEKATRAGISALLGELKQRVQQKDAVLLYMAGHGDMVGNEWFFIPHDVTTPEDEAMVKRLGVSAREITEVLKTLKAQKIFVVIDACKAGGFISGIAGLRGYEDRKVMKQLVRSTGTYVMSASTDKQYAAELKELGHGILTYAVIEGLQGKAGEKKVTVEGLIQYVKNRLPELTEKYRGVPQWPVSWGAGMDFPLALY